MKKGDPKIPGSGSKKGVPQKFHRGIKATLLNVWDSLDGRPDKCLLALAEKDPKWFFELMKGSFPKDMTVNIGESVGNLPTKDLLKLLLVQQQEPPESE